jgi:nucleolar complex protein 2
MDEDLEEGDEKDLFDDEEIDEPQPKKKGKKASLKSDISKHKEELEKLKEQDPEFYKFLQKEESGLLDFDVSDEDLEDGSDEEVSVMQENDAEEESQFADEEDVDLADLEDPLSSQADDSEAQVVTKQMIEEWAEAIETTKSVKTLRHLLSAFKCAARMNDEDDENTTYAYKVTSGSGECQFNKSCAVKYVYFCWLNCFYHLVFNKLILTTLRLTPVCLNYQLTPSTPSASPATARKYNLLKSMIKSYCSNVLHLLRGLTDSTMVYYVLKESEKCTKYFGCFARITKDYLRVSNIFTMHGMLQSKLIQWI